MIKFGVVVIAITIVSQKQTGRRIVTPISHHKFNEFVLIANPPAPSTSNKREDH